MKIFVFGATGSIGHNIVTGLSNLGHEVFAGTRHPDKGNSIKGVTWVKADALVPGQGAEILEKMDAAFFLSPPGLTDQFVILSPWFQKAIDVKLKKVVLMTAMGVEHAPAEAPFRKTELMLENSGLNWNIIRPNWFMQNFNTYWIAGILADQKLYFPGGDAVTSFIDTRDISNVAVHLLTKDEFKNQAFSLTGSETLTHKQVSEIISKEIGTNIEYVNITPDDFKKSLVNAGLSNDYADFMNYIASALRDGHASPITDSVQKITSKSPIKFAQYVKDHKDSWIKK